MNPNGGINLHLSLISQPWTSEQVQGISPENNLWHERLDANLRAGS